MVTRVSITAGVPQVAQVSIGDLGDPDPRGYQHLSVPQEPRVVWEPWRPSVHRPELFKGESE